MSTDIRRLCTLALVATVVLPSSASAASKAGLKVGLTVLATCQVDSRDQAKQLGLETPQVSCTLNQPFAIEGGRQQVLKPSASAQHMQAHPFLVSKKEATWTVTF